MAYLHSYLRIFAITKSSNWQSPDTSSFYFFYYFLKYKIDLIIQSNINGWCNQWLDLLWCLMLLLRLSITLWQKGKAMSHLKCPKASSSAANWSCFSAYIRPSPHPWNRAKSGSHARARASSHLAIRSQTSATISQTWLLTRVNSGGRDWPALKNTCLKEECRIPTLLRTRVVVVCDGYSYLR